MPSWVDRIAEAHVGYDTDYLIETLGGARRDDNGRFIKGSGSSARPSRAARPSSAPQSPVAAKKPNSRGFIRWLLNKAKSALKYARNKIGGRRELGQ